METVILWIYFLGIPIFAWLATITTRQLAKEDPSAEMAAGTPIYWFLMSLMTVVWPLAIVLNAIYKYRADKDERS